MFVKLVSVFAVIFVLTSACVAGIEEFIEISGPQSGVLETAEYLVTGNLSIIPGEQLTIEPGSIFRFDGNYAFDVGTGCTLICAGTALDSIIFTPNYDDGVTAWAGFSFIDANNATLLDYCLVAGSSSTGLYCNNSDITILNSTVRDNSDGYGGGIMASVSDITISGCFLTGNESIFVPTGAITCTGSSTVNISDCVISDNSSSGITCADSVTATIHGCTITNHSDGEAIGCLLSSVVTVTDCWISENVGYNGGGITCTNSMATIHGCTIVGNTGDGLAGGVYGHDANVTLENCTIAENSSDYGGAGIAGTVATVSNCIVSDNFGVGMHFATSNTTVSYCDFHDNNGGNFDGDVPADLGVLAATNANGDLCDIFQNIFLDPLYVNPYGGDFHLQQDSPCVDCGDPNSDPDPNDLTGIPDMGAYFYDRGELVIEVTDPVAGTSWERGTTEMITWTDNVYEDVKIELYEDQTLVAVIDEATQSDGSYNWAIPGDGPVGDDFSIRISSVVHPDVFGFSDTFTLLENQGPVSVAITPANPPVEIPASGGSFHFGIEITSNLGMVVQGDVWIKVVVPNGNVFGPVQQAFGITMNPGQTISVPDIEQVVPGGMTSGTYVYRAYVGMYPGLVVDFDEFPVEILDGASQSASMADWILHGWEASSFEIATLDDIGQEAIPQQFELFAAYPNPFNAMTTVRVALPETAQLSVVVYNVTGQRVATLADGIHEAGVQALAFDASNLASGLYFVRATVPGQLDQTQKVMLVR